MAKLRAKKGRPRRSTATSGSKPVLPAAHYEMVDVLAMALPFLHETFARLSATEGGLEEQCCVVFETRDDVGRDFVEAALVDVPANPEKVLILQSPFRGTMVEAADWYRMDSYIEQALGPGQLRVIVLSHGALLVVHLEPDTSPSKWNPVLSSDTYYTSREGVLLYAVTAWRSPKGAGFRFLQVFKTKAEGELFTALFEGWFSTLYASWPLPYPGLLEELERIGQTHRSNAPLEVATRAHALLFILVKAGLMTHDFVNGAVRVYGSELELQAASARAAEFGVPTAPMN